jgi:tousled-like kinase
MKSHGSLPEREAKSIIAQVLSALCYLNVRPRSFIHYDLKPANILFDHLGQCKITDFGLSKVVEEGHTQGMELTSQGAGTYWYLPPECFDVNRTPLISNKVDVWSVGVILFQMLYSRRPFGHELSQEQILRNEVMLNAREVQFPSKPSVSAECKDFITKCLMYCQEQRPDVHEAASHPFLNIKKRS